MCPASWGWARQRQDGPLTGETGSNRDDKDHSRRALPLGSALNPGSTNPQLCLSPSSTPSSTTLAGALGWWPWTAREWIDRGVAAGLTNDRQEAKILKKRLAGWLGLGLARMETRKTEPKWARRQTLGGRQECLWPNCGPCNSCPPLNQPHQPCRFYILCVEGQRKVSYGDTSYGEVWQCEHPRTIAVLLNGWRHYCRTVAVPFQVGPRPFPVACLRLQ
ncbi:hypothetical protein F5Y18DRAFT_49535 [Xylariaceae sp. FL1019]|nr:hypothetical protein F5Y18DRAFT_49535 [Xylariaceae sp. FL1019]